MKKTVLLLLAALLMQGIAQAADYDIWIAGVRVTDANKDGIIGPGISGTITYDPATRDLHLHDGVKIEIGNDYGIFIDSSDITTYELIIYGTVSIETRSAPALRFKNNKGESGYPLTCRIKGGSETGGDKLLIKSYESIGIELKAYEYWDYNMLHYKTNRVELRIYGCEVRIDAKTYGIRGTYTGNSAWNQTWYEDSEQLDIRNAGVQIAPTTHGAMDKINYWFGDKNAIGVWDSPVVVWHNDFALRAMSTGELHKDWVLLTYNGHTPGILAEHTNHLQLSPGEKSQITYKHNKVWSFTDYVWKSQEPDILSVDENGLVTAGSKIGETVITGIPRYYSLQSKVQDNMIICYGGSVKYYDLTVAGRRVNSFNAFDIMLDGSRSAIFTQNDTYDVLTLGGIKITAAAGESCIEYTGVKPLTIHISDKTMYNGKGVSLTSSGTAPAIDSYDANLTIEADAPLDISGPVALQSTYQSGMITFKGKSRINLTGTNGPAVRANQHSQRLQFESTKTAAKENFHVALKGVGKAVENIGAVYYKNVAPINPNKAVISLYLNTFANHPLTEDPNNIYSSVEIGDTYPIRVGPNTVTFFNSQDIAGNGKMSYDILNNTLTLKGAYFQPVPADEGETSNYYGIKSDMDLTLKLEGSNSIGFSNSYLAKNITEYGIYTTGKLNILSENLTDKLTINLKGNTDKVAGNYGIFATDEIEIAGDDITNENPAANITINSNYNGITSNSSINIRDNTRLEITTPNDVGYALKHNSTQLNVQAPSLIYEGEAASTSSLVYNLTFTDYRSKPYIRVGPGMTYPVYIADKVVTTDNAQDVLGDGGTVIVTSKVGEENISIHLTDATVNDDATSTADYAIMSELNIGYTFVEVSGNNTVYVGAAGIGSYNNVTIQGAGSLLFDSKFEGIDAAIYSDKDIEISGVNVTLSEEVFTKSYLGNGLYSKTGIFRIGAGTIVELFSGQTGSALATPANVDIQLITDASSYVYAGDTKAGAALIDRSQAGWQAQLKGKKYVLISPVSTVLPSINPADSGIQVRGGKGEIHIKDVGSNHDLSSNKTAYIYNVSGALIRTAAIGTVAPIAIGVQSTDNVVISNIQPGIYIVRVGNAAEKVVVR